MFFTLISLINFAWLDMKTLTTKTLSTDCLSQVIHVDPLLESVLKHEEKKKFFISIDAISYLDNPLPLLTLRLVTFLFLVLLLQANEMKTNVLNHLQSEKEKKNWLYSKKGKKPYQRKYTDPNIGLDKWKCAFEMQLNVLRPLFVYKSFEFL